MKERMAYRFRLYPDEGQARLFRRTIGCCRVVYNTCLEQKRLERHRSEPRRLTAIDQNNQIGDLKSALPWMKEVPHHCLQQAVIDLHKAFRNFFEKRAAFPKPRRKYQNESFRFPDPKQIMFRDGAIFLPKARWVRMVAHREIVGTVKNVTVSMSGDHWYASIQVEREVEEPAGRDTVEIGGDLGVVHGLVLSDGTVYDLPRMSDKEKRKEENLARIVSRRKEGSRNRARAQRALRRFKAKMVRATRSCVSAAAMPHAPTTTRRRTFYIWAERPEPEDLRCWPVKRTRLRVGSRKKKVAVRPRKQPDQDQKLGPSGPREVTRVCCIFPRSC
jgi:transposase